MGNTASSARNDHGKTRTSAEAAAASHLSVASAGERNNWSSSRGRGERKPFGAPATTAESVVTSVAAGGAAATTTNTNAAEESAAAAVAAQRLKQTSVWSLGSLSGRLNWSFTGGASRNSFHGRNRSARKSTTSLQHQRRSKTVWHKPITNTIFSTHFKESSRNEEFRIEQLIAKGAFGVVFKVIDKTQRSEETPSPSPSQSLHFYALKVLKKSKVIEENSVQQIKEEADIQKLCGHHPFIVQQIDLWQNRRNLHILSEYVPNGELFTKITAFSIELVRLYLAEIALAVDFLHNAGIIYRDAKPENILLTGSYHIKLIDFGLSKWLKLGATTRTMCGTFQYMAPEILRGEVYTHAVDWWSIGIIVCQMLTQKSPDIKGFLDIVPPDVIQDDVDNAAQKSPPPGVYDKTHVVKDFLPPEVRTLAHEARDVVERLLTVEPRQRLRSVMALQRIALYKNFKINATHLLSISPLVVMHQSGVTLREDGRFDEIDSALAAKAFHGF